MPATHRHDWSRTLQESWLRRGPLAAALLPAAALYAMLIAARELFYRAGWLATHTLDVPVIIVGNLIAGGAGKTPTVIAVVSLLRRHGYTPGIVSRGYARQGTTTLEVRADTSPNDCGDEPKLLLLRTHAPVMVGYDRVAAGRELLRRHPEVDVLVCDDGIQHLALARTAQVIVFDERGVGNGWLLPAGPLREALSRQCPQRSVVLYNAAAPSTPWPGSLARRVLTGVVELRPWWRGETASPAALASLRDRPLLAAAGTARPERFFDMLSTHGLSFDSLPLPDHYPFTQLPWPDTATDVVITEKDAVKIDPQRVGATRVWVATLDLRMGPGFDSALMSLLPEAHPVRPLEIGVK
ncbi:MAG: tetraacyldisaccharide 4'-kinase [Burkholderiaceae bacterium]